jgi:acetyl esterase
MPLDPTIRMMLDQLEAAGGPPLSEATPAEAREMFVQMAALDGQPEEVASVRDAVATGPAGDIPVRVYEPAGTTGDRRPVVVWYHGGGWVIGDLDSHDGACRRLANRTGAVVVAVHYRLAPEDRFPAAADDAFAALRWVHANAAELGVEPDRIAVAGDSAGGNLSAVTALRTRDEGGPTLRFQALIYPVTDLTMTTASYAENADGYLLTREGMEWFAGHYLGTADAKDPLASPFFADDVSGLAPALVITAEFDPLRDEGEAYAARLKEAGVPVEVVRYDGMIHGFYGMGGLTPVALEAAEKVAAALKAALA